MNAALHILNNKASPNKIAVLTASEEFSYADILQETIRIARHLVEQGLAKGDRVVLLSDSSFFWIVCYLGTILAGGVSVPLPPAIKWDRLRDLIDITASNFAFIKQKYPKITQSINDMPLKIIDDSFISSRTDPSVHRENVNSSEFHELRESAKNLDDKVDLASIMFTSGSTGEPRGVMITHRNIIANTDSIIDCLDLHQDDRIMAILPFFYCYGTSLLHTHLKIGGSIVVDERAMYPEAILNELERTNCTGLAGVSSTFQILLRNSTFRERNLPSLRYAQQAGGKLPDVFIEDLIQAMPGKKIFIMYGQTEGTARLSWLPPDMLELKIGSIGKGIPGVTLKVLNDSGKPVAVGEIGEIVAEGDNISPGYWDCQYASDRTFANRQLHTGDLARVDDDGFIYIVDRRNDFLKCGGYRISSKEIENIILKFPGTVETAVVPQEDDKLGEAVRLYVVHSSGEMIESELKKHCVSNLEWPFIPRRTVFLRSLPKTSTGKVDKQRLKPERFDNIRKNSSIKRRAF